MAAVKLFPITQFFDNYGNPLIGGKIYTYYYQTTIPKKTYANPGGTVLLPNPIILDSAGRKNIYLEGGDYDFAIYDSNNLLVTTLSGINAETLISAVESVSQLKALNISTNQSAIVRTLGYYSPGDGGGNWFYWDSAATNIPDDGMIIQPSSLPTMGRWIGIISADKKINLRVYGAKCDGVIDDTSSLIKCNGFCDVHNCKIIIDGNAYIASDPGLTVPVEFTSTGKIKTGNYYLRVIPIITDTNQHFEVSEDWAPYIGSDHIYPQWFGETDTNDPITSEVKQISPSEFGYRTKTFLHDIEVLHGGTGGKITCGILNVGIAAILDRTEVNGELTAHEGIVVTGQASVVDGADGMRIGADINGQTITDQTEKNIKIRVPHYYTSEEDFVVLEARGEESSNVLNIGGGHSLFNTATVINFYTVNNNTTLGGDLRMKIFGDGSVMIGGPIGGPKGAGTLNAQAVYDDGVLLTGYVLDKYFNPDFDYSKWERISPKALEEFVPKESFVYDIDKYHEYVRKNRVLPSMEKIEAAEERPSIGELAQKLWEIVEIQTIHIIQLNEKIKQLEEIIRNG